MRRRAAGEGDGLSYELGYAVFGVLFVIGAIGYWIATLPLRDAAAIYLPDSERPTTPAPR